MIGKNVFFMCLFVYVIIGLFIGDRWILQVKRVRWHSTDPCRHLDKTLETSMTFLQNEGKLFILLNCVQLTLYLDVDYFFKQLYINYICDCYFVHFFSNKTNPDISDVMFTITNRLQSCSESESDGATL